MGVPTVIRTSGRWLLRLMAVIIPLTLAAAMLLMHREVQDGMGRMAARYLSRQLATRVELEGFYLGPTGRMRVDRLAIYDRSDRIVLELQPFYAYIDPLHTGLRQVKVHEMVVGRLILHITHDRGARTFAHQFLLDALPSEEGNTGESPFDRLRVGSFRLKSGRVCYHDYRMDAADNRQFQPHHLELDKLRLTLKNIQHNRGLWTATLAGLRFNERAGFCLDSLSGAIRVDSTGLSFDSWRLQAPDTRMAGDFRAEWGDDTGAKGVEPGVYRVSLDESVIAAPILAYFLGPQAPATSLSLRGVLEYRKNQITGQDVRLALGRPMFARGDFRITELNASVGPRFALRVDDARWDKPSWSRSFPAIQLPSVLDPLQQLSFQATFAGQPDEFEVEGTFTDGRGTAVTDLSVQLDGPNSTYNGQLSLRNFNVGQWLGDTLAGRLDIDANLEAVGDRAENLRAKLAGALQRIDYRGYSYGPVQVRGDYSLRTFRGQLASEDPNACFIFQGMADWQPAVPRYDFVASIDELDLQALGLSAVPFVFSGRVDLTGSGQKPDELEGKLTGSDWSLVQGNRQMDLDNITLSLLQGNQGDTTTWGGNGLTIDCATPFGSAIVRGDGKIGLLTSAIRSAMGLNLTPQERAQLAKMDSSARFTLELDLDRAQALTRSLFPELLSLNRLLFFARLNPQDGGFDFSMDASDVHSGDLHSDRISLLGKRKGNRLEADIFTGTVNMGQQRILENLRWFNTLERDTLRYTLEGTGALEGQLARLQGISVRDSTGYQVHIDSSHIEFFNQSWALVQRLPVVYAPERISLGDFTLKSDSMEMSCRGVVGAGPGDLVEVNMAGVPLAPLAPFVLPKEYRLDGKMQLNVNARSVLNRPELTGTLLVPGLSYDGQPLGDLFAQSKLDPGSRAMQISADVRRLGAPAVANPDAATDSSRLLTVSGIFSRMEGKDSLDLGMNLAGLPAWVLNPLLRPIFDSLNGGVNGQLRLLVHGPRTELTGWADLTKNRLHVDFLDQSFWLDRRITLLPDQIRFDSVAVTDGQNGTGWVTGSLLHRNLDRFTLNLQVDARKMQVINTPPSYKEAFFGVGRATGLARITGDFYLVDIDVVATTERGTKIDLPLDGEGSRTGSQFITFASPAGELNSPKANEEFHPEGVSFRMNLDMSRDAEFRVLFDRAAGDILKGSGEGQMRISYKPDGELLMDGGYTVNSGDYTFTLANLPGKKFKLEPGGTITWSGDPYDAQLDLSAVYRQRCDVDRLLDPAQLQNEPRKQITVDTYLKLKGSLMKPDVEFQLKLPGNSDENSTDPVAARIRSINQNEQELNNQVLALLIAGQFFPSDNAALTSLLGSTGANSLTEVLSNQLNNLLSQMFDNVSLGITYRNRSNLVNSGSPARQGDVAVAGNFSLFDDRLLIDGKLGNNSIQTANSTALAGEIMVEYLMTRDGAVRMKAFNRLDDRILNNSDSNYRYGVGLSLTENYDSMRDLRQKISKRFRSGRAGE